jgi:hypothetical protein
MSIMMHLPEVRPRKIDFGFDLISCASIRRGVIFSGCHRSNLSGQSALMKSSTLLLTVM